MMEHAISQNFWTAGEQLALTAAGRSDTMPRHTFGPAVRPYYLIHYVLAGAGTFTSDGITYHLHAGQGFLIVPNQQTIYRADQQTPWSYVWVGFTGSMAPYLIDQLQISPTEPIFGETDRTTLVKCVNQLLQLEAHPHGQAELSALRYLLEFLSTVAQAPAVIPNELTPMSDYIQKSITYLSHHLDTVTVPKLAAAVGLNRSYFSQLFSNATGQTPSTYLQNFRLTTARHLLESTDLTINEIAERTGYQHPQTFRRAFKATFGLSPRTYRQRASFGSKAAPKPSSGRR